MGMEVFQQKEPENPRPTKLAQPFQAPESQRKNYGHQAISESFAFPRSLVGLPGQYRSKMPQNLWIW